MFEGFSLFPRKPDRYNEPDAYYQPKNLEPDTNHTLSKSLQENIVNMRSYCSNTTDFLDRSIQVSGVNVSVLMLEGMINMDLFTQIMVKPLSKLEIPDCTGEKLADWVSKYAIFAGDQKEVYNYQDLFGLLMAGFVILLIDGVDHAVACGLQGYKSRSVGEPSSEMNVRGSREGFVEAVRTNQTMIRRRIKSPTLKFEMIKVGQKSQTDVSIVYLTDTAKPELVQQIKHQLTKVTSDIILNAGYLQPYLEGKPLSLFSAVGVTERPDTVCAKINEGRVVLLVDGVPFALVVPTLFCEHFQSMDDYAYRPFYATFIRILKYIAFLISIFLPGLYVATTVFNPEMIPDALLFNIATSEQLTPFSMMTEALVIHLIYELMREAGLRLPRPVGHAVSIVGALVIGDAAVTAGIIGSPMVMIVAMTAISSFVVPSLYESVAILKFVFIVVGGTWGLYGISVGFVLVLTNLCALTSFGTPITSPAAPFLGTAMRDTFIRVGWKQLGTKRLHVQKMPGSTEK